MIKHKRRSIGKTIKKTLIAIFLMIVLFGAAGTAYVYVTGRSEAARLAATPAETPAEPFTDPKPVQIDPNAPVGASVLYIASPVRPGENSSINVHTRPDAKCKIVAAYNEVVSKDSGLVEKTADVHGSVAWTWTVDKSAALGKWPIKVTCAYNDRTGFVQGDLEVIK